MLVISRMEGEFTHWANNWHTNTTNRDVPPQPGHSLPSPKLLWVGEFEFWYQTFVTETPFRVGGLWCLSSDLSLVMKSARLGGFPSSWFSLDDLLSQNWGRFFCSVHFFGKVGGGGPCLKLMVSTRNYRYFRRHCLAQKLLGDLNSRPSSGAIQFLL